MRGGPVVRRARGGLVHVSRHIWQRARAVEMDRCRRGTVIADRMVIAALAWEPITARILPERPGSSPFIIVVALVSMASVVPATTAARHTPACVTTAASPTIITRIVPAVAAIASFIPARPPTA